MKKFIKNSPFFRSIQWRLVIILCLITFTLMTIVWVYLTSQVESIFYAAFKDPIERNFSALPIDEETSEKELERILYEDIVISGLIRGEDRSYTIINKKTNEIVFSSDPLYKENRTQFRNDIYKSVNLLSVLSSESSIATGVKQSYTKAKKGDFYDYVRTQALSDGDYVLFFKYGRSKALVVINQFNRSIFMGLLFSILAALGIGILLSRTITRPITKIMHKAEKITQGDFGQVLEIQSDDEIGKLTRTFNYMSMRLKEMLTEVSSEKNKVETILNYMTDGIIAFGIDGELLHTNEAVRKILKNLTYDMDFNQFVGLFGLELTLDEVMAQEKNSGLHKVQYQDRFLKLQFATFSDENNRIEGIIVVVQDITEEHKLENMRREFVANVSHELRTPLTSVKSYTETLLDGALEDKETAQHFLSVINDETDRMTRLVRDLLILSQHDSGITLTFEDVSLVELASACVDRMRIEAEKKKQELRLQIKQNMPLIKADRHRIDQLLINIIGNAIKYTPEKGRIIVSLYCEKDMAVVLVEDNGIGVPEQDLNRIFERFYRVDKARSRQMGGTGLGLAIAKEIALLHGGNISAKSKVGRGTQIYIELPLKRTQAT